MTLQKTTDLVFDDTKEISRKRAKVKDAESFNVGYRLGYKRGYAKVWNAQRLTEEKVVSEIVYDGMALIVPGTRHMVGVYRSGALLALFNTQMEAERHMKASCSLRQVEEYGYKMRCVPLMVSLSLKDPPS